MSIEKGKSSKKIKFEYIVIVILVVLALVIFFTSSNINLTTKKTSKNSENSTFYDIEAKLNSVLENIDGVGKVDLIISYKSSNQKDYLTNTETSTDNGKTTTTSTTILVGGEPIVIKEYNPDVQGIVVVCEGADNLNVKLKITEVLLTIFNVSSDNIRIIKMK